MMKVIKLIYIFIISSSFHNAFSQEEKILTKDSKLDFKPYFFIGFNAPFQYGNTALADAHSSNIGFSAQLGLLTFKGFYFGFGTDSDEYNVEKTELIGNYPISKHNSYFAFLSYEFEVMKKISFSPIIGFGSSELVIKKGGKRRGKQDGNEFRIGTSINYNINKKNAICLNINYINNVYEVNTTESLQEYFSRSNQIQIGLGYKFM